jgi:hypothetical protein
MAITASNPNRVRTGGILTTFNVFGAPIAFCQQVAYQSPQPVGQGASAIQPMDEPVPIEIITPYAAGMGQITLNLYELFGYGGNSSKVWDRLGVGPAGTSTAGSVDEGGSFATTSLGSGSGGVFASAVDIVDIFILQAQMDPSALKVVKYIFPLSVGGAPGQQINTLITEEYNGCVITNVIDGEQIDVTTLEIIKQITIGFRYVTRGGDPGLKFGLRDNALSNSGAS